MGRISNAHLKGLSDASEVARIAAVCDTREDVVKKAADDVGARAYTDYRALLVDPEVQVVDLPLPHNLHYPMARHALESGKHVLVEKPLAPTALECKELIDLARLRSLTLGVAENTPFVSAYLAVRSLLQSGRIGQPRLIRTFISGSEVDRLTDISSWKGRRAGTVGGAILDAGPHSFYLLKWLFGEIDTVQAVANKVVDVSEVEDNAIVTGQLKSGPFFRTEYSFTAEIPWGERLEIYGSKGSIILDQLVNPPALHYRSKEDVEGVPVGAVEFQPDRVEHDPKGWKFKSIAAGVSEFARAVAGGSPAPVRAEDGLYTIKVVEAAYASVEAGGISVRV